MAPRPSRRPLRRATSAQSRDMSTEFPAGAGPASNDPVPRPGPAPDGAEPDVPFPDLTLSAAPRAPEPVVAARPKKSRSSRPAKAVVPPPLPVPQITTGPEEGPQEPLLPPSSITVCTWSLAFHVLLLLIMGLWFFSAPRTEQRSFDS